MRNQTLAKGFYSVVLLRGIVSVSAFVRQRPAPETQAAASEQGVKEEKKKNMTPAIKNLSFVTPLLLLAIICRELGSY